MKKTKKLKKIKQPSINSLKKKAWKLCSEYVRRSNADKDGTVSCYTCGVKKHWKEIQAGHAIPGRHNAILFYLKAIKPQCIGCNLFKSGNYTKFHIRLEKEYGFGILQELENVDKENHKFTVAELLEKIEFFKNELKKL